MAARAWAVALLVMAPAAAMSDELLVLHKRADSLGFYDPVNGRRLATVRVGRKPHEMVLSADGRLVYVTNYGVDSYTDKAEGGRTLSIVDVRRRARWAEIDLGEARRPHGIVRGRSGRLYVTVDQPPSLLVIDPGRRAVLERHAIEQSLPHMVAVVSDETKAYTANAGSGTVTVVALDRSRPAKHISIGGVPMGLALSADGRRLFAANRGGQGVAIIDTARDELEQVVEVPGQPARLRLLPDGGLLLVSLMEAGAVALVDMRTLREVRRLTAGAHPEGMAVDRGGRFGYVSAQGEDKVVKFSLGDWKPVLEIRTEARPDPLVLLEEP